MKPFVVIMILAVVAVSMTGCVYTHITMPLSTELNKTDLGHKRGEASMYSILWLFAWGDAGAAAAAKEGDVSVLTHMDREIYLVLFGLYARQVTIVYGE